MQAFDPILWLLLAAVAGGSTLASVYVLARRYERERTVHDLKVRVNHLRTVYATRLAEIAARETSPVIEAEPIDEQRLAA